MIPTSQDQGVPAPPVRLRLVLALVRILAGRRGRAALTWHAGGFRYELTATRSGGVGVSVDSDPTVRDRDAITDRVRDALVVQP